MTHGVVIVPDNWRKIAIVQVTGCSSGAFWNNLCYRLFSPIIFFAAKLKATCGSLSRYPLERRLRHLSAISRIGLARYDICAFSATSCLALGLLVAFHWPICMSACAVSEDTLTAFRLLS